MLVAISMFVLGLVIATVINHRFFPHIIVETVIEKEEVHLDGVHLTNQQVSELVEDVAFLVPQNTIRIGKRGQVFFTNRNTGEVIMLSNGKWRYPTANTRACGVKASHQPIPAPEYPVYATPEPPPGY